MRKLILTLSIMTLSLACCGKEKTAPPPEPEQQVSKGPINVQEEDLPAKPADNETAAPTIDEKSTG